MSGKSREVDPWGRVLVSPEQAFELFYHGVLPENMTVKDDDAARQYNALCQQWDRPGEQFISAAPLDISPEDEWKRRVENWWIPDEYTTMDMRPELLARCSTDTERDRVNLEMDLFEQRGLVPLLRSMFALVDHFRQNGVVWGVGRGSSVASYVLFLIGVHKIDAIRFGLDIREFLK